VSVFRTGTLFLLPLSPASLSMLDGTFVLGRTRGAADALGFLDRPDPTPVMRGWIAAAAAVVRERKKEFVRCPVLGIAAAPPLGDTNETERLGLADRRRHSGAVHAVFYKIIGRDWEPPIVVPAMVAKLDFDTRYHLAG
jgi:hypothetical protein